MIFKVIYKDVDENTKQKIIIKTATWVSFIEELQDEYGITSSFEINYAEDNETIKENFLNYITNDFNNPDSNYIITKLKIGEDEIFENGQTFLDDD